MLIMLIAEHLCRTPINPDARVSLAPHHGLDQDNPIQMYVNVSVGETRSCDQKLKSYRIQAKQTVSEHIDCAFADGQGWASSRSINSLPAYQLSYQLRSAKGGFLMTWVIYIEARKPVFGVSDTVRLKTVSSATVTS